MAKSSRGNGRARIVHEPNLSCHSPGKRHRQHNPNFEVQHQDEPTTDDPRRQHAKLAESHPPHLKGFPK